MTRYLMIVLFLISFPLLSFAEMPVEPGKHPKVQELSMCYQKAGCKDIKGVAQDRCRQKCFEKILKPRDVTQTCFKKKCGAALEKYVSCGVKLAKEYAPDIAQAGMKFLTRVIVREVCALTGADYQFMQDVMDVEYYTQ